MSGKFLAALVLVAMTIGTTIGLSGFSSAQDQPGDSTLTVRVAVQLLGKNLVEVGIEYDDEDEPILPERRKIILTHTERKRWVTSSPVVFHAPFTPAGATNPANEDDAASADLWATPGFGTVPIELSVTAWIEADRSIWFAIVHDGEPIHPERRRLSRSAIIDPANHNRWLKTSAVEIEIRETPASLLRTFSEHVTVPAGMPHTNQHQTLIDIARSCRLDSVSPFEGNPDPEPDWSRWPEEEVAPNGYPAFRWKVINSDQAHSSSVDAVWLWRNQRQTSYWTGQPASEYLFIVRDIHPPRGTTMWAAVFDCSAVDESGTTEHDIDLEAASVPEHR